MVPCSVGGFGSRQPMNNGFREVIVRIPYQSLPHSPGDANRLKSRDPSNRISSIRAKRPFAARRSNAGTLDRTPYTKHSRSNPASMPVSDRKACRFEPRRNTFPEINEPPIIRNSSRTLSGTRPPKRGLPWFYGGSIEDDTDHGRSSPESRVRRGDSEPFPSERSAPNPSLRFVSSGNTASRKRLI